MLKEKLYRHLEPSAWLERGMSPTNIVVSICIVIASCLAIIETEKPLADAHHNLFFVFETVFFIIFAVEYVARVYAAGEELRYRGFWGRIRYIFSFWALIDLIALLPYLLWFGNYNAFFMRILRVIRIFRLARLGRFSLAMQAFFNAIAQRRYEFVLSVIFAFALLLFSSAILYAIEAPYQPEEFGSIPRALWWSVATLTTVGYGDVTPITGLGKFFAGVTAIAGIGMIAMPTGIMAAAFSDAYQTTKNLSDMEREERELYIKKLSDHKSDP
ncbi:MULTISPECIES: ion transporter [Gammaproteobacteria]|uniref:ion transporter n=1 Tax=Gammaproteobacteria TaxID=1236 RepID=UPI000DD04BFE|nr:MULTISPECIES: ion transporter [Gammaproteobacteria]RTE87080.1 ion transporter [Aliidiomarina sp. B3213]TCZ93131.1 ion transporter [Lysobacter sp. N42]